MKIQSNIKISAGKNIKGIYLTFNFEPKKPQEVPDDFANALVKTYPHIYSVVEEKAKAEAPKKGTKAEAPKKEE